MKTIRSSREIDAMFETAAKIPHPLLMALVAPAADASGGRVCFVAGRRLGGAVVRNRLKRLLREGIRRAGGPPKTLDVILVARPGLARADTDEIDAAIRSVLDRAQQP